MAGDRDLDWWRVTITGTANARLDVTLAAQFDLTYELYRLPDNDCASRVLLDYYKTRFYGAALGMYSPCLVPGTYYIRISPESPVACAQPEYNQYKLHVALTQSGCPLCALTCAESPDDPCPENSSAPDTNDLCHDPNSPGAPMPLSVGSFPQYGAQQCGRIATATAPDGAPWADRDFFEFTMPSEKTRLYIRAKAQFRMTLRLFDTQCQPIVDPNGIQRSAGWDQTCGPLTVQTIADLTPGMTYWMEVLYGNGKAGAYLEEWFEGLPCTTDRNTYQIELAAHT